MNKRDRIKMERALRDVILEASEEELREALGKKFDALVERGRAAARRALDKTR